ncbi:MAG: leucyl aminopeptidase, partial [Cyanobacteria bacterium REEB65]|nr:leucyl aminopeptidase [Cyanobacteria bacterium REEB65]
AAARAAQIVRDNKLKTFGASMLDHAAKAFGVPAQGQAIAEGILLGLYSYDAYKTERDDKNKSELEAVTFFAPDNAVLDLKAGIATGEKLAAAVKLARDLVAAPAKDLTPAILADRAKKMASQHGIHCQILDEKAIQKHKMGALLGVAKGSLAVQPPRFIVLEYLPIRGAKPLVFVGKGITFDSGGISIKPAEGMEKMKYDMAGGAAVIGALQAIASLRLPVNVVGLIPATENMPGGDAIHPGDILTTMSGKTIEVINTDAEGRLILSDALTYAERYKPEAVVDLATLTGACVIALGHQAIGLLGNDQALMDKLKESGERTWERVWQLPLWEEYNDQIKSDLADMKNSGGRAAGTITAAAMLAKFTSEYRWAHLDIAGTAWEEKGRPYAPKGATGIGVRLLCELARMYSKVSANGTKGQNNQTAKSQTAKSPSAKAAATGRASKKPTAKSSAPPNKGTKLASSGSTAKTSVAKAQPLKAKPVATNGKVVAKKAASKLPAKAAATTRNGATKASAKKK